MTQEQIKNLENTVVLLKARSFDLSEQVTQYQAQAQEFTTALSEIAKIVGITGETVKLEDIVKAVIDLVPAKVIED
ncbi:tail fiber chaperone [Pectobacterium bacteriophage PM2]|uniref:Chaperone for tail fiber formation n=1 Tax=Pectobacterium bacteriophage PM2 TaxID=1429794 RepID=A0A0A0Q0H9_9CAUD|nr:tail fiber chaperone [Pectobacterium bacteriophage PM2]AHY25126.1 chaperone for tail fiber formation [Pectobacterium bacteriophage PM2]